MSRINSNVASLIAQHQLQGANKDLQVRLERLSTGLAINRGADNPSGLIVSERLRSEIESIGQSISNTERASNVIATTEAALTEIATLLNSIKGLTVEAANDGGMSKQEIAANQLQIDSAVESITRISNSTTFAGLQLLNGNLDYRVSGVDSTKIQDVKVLNGNFGTHPNIPVSVEVLASAKPAQLWLSGGNGGGGTGPLLSTVTFEIRGELGVEVFTFVSATPMSAVIEAVNRASDVTGVSASFQNGVDSAAGMVFTSTSYGTDAFVSVRKLEDGAFFNTYYDNASTAATYDEGEDVLALVNGNLAVGDGTSVSLHSNALNLEMNLTVAAATTTNAGAPHTFVVTGGGAMFQIGPSVNTNQQVGFGIQSVAASHLGNETDGFLNSIVDGGPNSLTVGRYREAGEIIDASIQQIAILRGRLGAFERNTLDTAARSQQVALENLTSSESQIRDADFATETAALSRAQILVNAGTQTLQMANSTAQNVLGLLQG